MKRAMVIRCGRNKVDMHLCAACDTSLSSVVADERIPNFYSEEHAVDCGWRKTTNLMFRKPGEPFAWICPECSARTFR